MTTQEHAVQADTWRRLTSASMFGVLPFAHVCERCGRDTFPPPPWQGTLSAFMLSDALWSVASLDGQMACLCLSCTEHVLGSRLPSWAFRIDEMPYPRHWLTADLADRLDPSTDGDFQINTDAERGAIARREFSA